MILLALIYAFTHPPSRADVVYISQLNLVTPVLTYCPSLKKIDRGVIKGRGNIMRKFRLYNVENTPHHLRKREKYIYAKHVKIGISHVHMVIGLLPYTYDPVHMTIYI